MWTHVDASRGGGVLLAQEHKHKMQGVAQADSCTWNPHKMMGVPLSASALLVKKK